MGMTAKTDKGTRTRQAILAAAIDLFQTKGYEETTMRLIATQAGVSLGNAYHYFQSKEELIQSFYESLCRDQTAAVAQAVATEKTLRNRLVAAVGACLAVLQPHRELLNSMMAVAGSPKSRLSPFGVQTRTVRDEAVQMFAHVLEGSDERTPEDIKADLPFSLWLYYMGILFLWLHDTSFGWQRTIKLLNTTAGLVSTLLMLLKLPAPTPLRKPLVDFLHDIRQFFD